MLRNFLSSFIIFFLVPALTLYLILSSFDQVFLNQENFTKVLSESKVYSRVSSEILPLVLTEATKNSSETNISIPPSIIKNLVNSDQIKTSLPKDLEKVVTSIHGYIISETPTLNAKIDLSVYTSSLQNNLSPEIANYIQTLKDCSPEETTAYKTAEDKGIPSCKPIGVSNEQILKNASVERFQKEITNLAPKTVTITENKFVFDPSVNLFSEKGDKVSPDGDSQNSLPFKDLRTLVGGLKDLAQVLLLASVLLTLLLIATRLKNISSALKWVSLAIFSAAVPLLLISSAVVFFVKKDQTAQIITSVVKAENNEMGKATIALISDLSVGFTQKISSVLQTQTFILLIIGIACWGLHLFLKTRGLPLKKPLPEEKLQVKVNN